MTTMNIQDLNSPEIDLRNLTEAEIALISGGKKYMINGQNREMTEFEKKEFDRKMNNLNSKINQSFSNFL
jgi:hypothetical protein